MTIGLPIEIKVREYLSKIFLGIKLVEKLNQDVLIGEKNKVYSFFKNSKNFYLISKGGPLNLFRFDKKKFSNNYLGLLDEEAPLSNIPKQALLPRIHKKILNNVDDYFTWGKKDENIIKNLIQNKKKIYTFGHPKFDLLKEENLSIFNADVRDIKKRYKNLIFIPSSFVVDQVLGDKNTERYEIEQFLNKKSKKKKSEYRKSKVYEEQNYQGFINLLVEISENNPKYNFVFRPHPRQSVKLIKNRFVKLPKNLHIVFKGTVTPWIIACDLYFHYGCTSSFEASILKKKIILFVNDEKAYKTRNLKLFKSLGYTFNNYEKCKNFINYHLKNNLRKLNQSKPPVKYISNSEKISFHSNFIKFFRKKYSKNLSNINHNNIKKIFKKKRISLLKNRLSFLKNVIIKNETFIDIIKSFNSNLLLTKEYKKKKFDKISFLEIKRNIKNLSKNLDLKTQIKVMQIDENLFLLCQKRKK